MDDLVWHDVREWGVEGRAFADTENFFDRLPARAKGVVRDEVWNLSRHSTGMSAHFAADAPAIHVRYSLTSEGLALPNMPASGVSGVDLYAMYEGQWRWLGTHQPHPMSRSQKLRRTLGIAQSAALITEIQSGRRAYHINLPLHNGVKSLEIGIPKGASFTPIAPRKIRPMLWYGTSITHGLCASRSGMTYLSILGRRLNRPILNFGFSGNGRMEIEVVRFLAEIDAAIFVIDCVANTSPQQIAERAGPLVKLLREKHSTTPILLLGQRKEANLMLLPKMIGDRKLQDDALRHAYEQLHREGISNLHYRGGEDVIGSDGEGTVDGSHPNDLGMMRYADALEPDLRRLLGE
jgi:lysophospholipase L1-like esterase